MDKIDKLLDEITSLTPAELNEFAIKLAQRPVHPKPNDDPFHHFADGTTEENLDPETRRMADAVEESMRNFGVEGINYE